MIKRLLPITSVAVALSLSTPSFAQNFDSNDFNKANQSLQSLSDYVKNLGGYLGYDLTQPPGNLGSSLIEDVNKLQLASALSIYAYTGAIPVLSMMTTLGPSSTEGLQLLNSYANAVFSTIPYNSPKTSQGKVTVNALTDQVTYQNDPVSQAVLNILGTPNDSYCLSNDGKSYISDCKLLTQGQVTINSVGTFPNPQDYFTYDAIQNLLPQLSVNSLTGPFLYQTQAENQNTTSSPVESSSSQNKGLQALSQAQAAQNFIVNASGSLLRPTLPSKQSYDSLYAKAMNLSKNTSLIEQKAAQKALSQYMAQLRTYAAQVSIGIGNFYYSLAKRLPQNPANAQTPTSQALNEFQMATYRLFKAGNRSNDTQWIQKLNDASPATTQKEIALLLAEVNYQLYLNRQIQERQLLTNSIILLNTASQSKPDGSNLDSST